MKKLKIEDIEKEIQDKGWKLLSTEYINTKTDLKMSCPEGHDVYISLDKWRQRPICPVCSSNILYKPSQIAHSKKSYRVIGLDQASNITGWSIYEDNKLISYGIFETTKKDYISRINEIKMWLASMIQKWTPDFVEIEDIQLQTFQVNGKTTEAVSTYKKLAILYGVIMEFMYEQGIPCESIGPSAWRKFNGVKGRSRADQKASAQQIVKNLYDISVSNDVADAILIGTYGCHHHKENELMF